MNDSSNQRSSPRYRCRCHATLCSTQESWQAHLLNISENGALVAVLDEHHFATDSSVELNIEAPEGDDILLQGSIAHIKEHYVGIECNTINASDHQRLRSMLDKLKA